MPRLHISKPGRWPNLPRDLPRVAIASGASALALAAVGVAWRTFAGDNEEDTPAGLAALTAAAVSDAARSQVLELADQPDGDPIAAIERSATEALRDAAAAGADITAAAIGAVEGAQLVAAELGVERRTAAEHAAYAVAEAARTLGPAAESRVQQALRRRIPDLNRS